MEIIKDKEIILTEENDFLGTYPYVKLIKNIINSNKETLRIALYGDWGTGKSTVLKTLENDIKKDENGGDAETKFITFDAWKHSNSFRRSFLIKLSKEIKNNHFRNLFTFTEIDRNIFIIFFLLSVLMFFIYQIEFINKSGNILGIIFAFLAYFADKLWNLHFKNLEKPENFKKIYKKIINEFYSNELFKCDNKKLVIIIDNIDRCDQKDALNILFDIKTILDSNKNIIFIIPLDKAYILEALSSKKEKDNYLKKLFDLEIYIKEYSKQDMFEYTKKLIENNFIEYENYLSSKQKSNIAFLISQRYSKDPRKIIKFLNLLKVEIYLYKTKESKTVIKHIDFLAKVLIIREQWPDNYRELVLRPYYLLGEYNSDDNNSTEINELINLRKELNSSKPHYFLGWDNGKLNKFSVLLGKNFEWKKIKEEILNTEEDINVFFTALEYKFQENQDKENLYKIIFNISNDKDFCKNSDIMTSLNYILKNNWEDDYFFPNPDKGDYLFYKYYQEDILLPQSAKNFSIYGKNNFLRDKILELLTRQNLSIENIRLYYATNLFKSYSETGNDIYENKLFYNFFDEIRDGINKEIRKTLTFKKINEYKPIFKLLKYKEFKENSFFSKFFRNTDISFWIYLIRENLGNIIIFYNYVKEIIVDNIDLYGYFLKEISDTLLTISAQIGTNKKNIDESELKEVLSILKILLKAEVNFQDRDISKFEHVSREAFNKLNKITILNKNKEIKELIEVRANQMKIKYKLPK